MAPMLLRPSLIQIGSRIQVGAVAKQQHAGVHRRVFILVGKFELSHLSQPPNATLREPWMRIIRSSPKKQVELTHSRGSIPFGES